MADDQRGDQEDPVEEEAEVIDGEGAVEGGELAAPLAARKACCRQKRDAGEDLAQDQEQRGASGAVAVGEDQEIEQQRWRSRTAPARGRGAERSDRWRCRTALIAAATGRCALAAAWPAFAW